jgi:hypothetical protein
MGDGPILKLTSKLNLNLVCTKESTATKDVGTQIVADHDPSLMQFNFKLQLVSGGGCWLKPTVHHPVII